MTKLVSLTALDSLRDFDGSWKRPTFNVSFVLQLEGNIEINKLREGFEECFDLNKHNVDKEKGDELQRYVVKKGDYVFRARLEDKGRLDFEEQIVKRFLVDPETFEDFIAIWNFVKGNVHLAGKLRGYGKSIRLR